MALRKPVLLFGLPGVSKTTMLQALADHLGGGPERFIWVTGDEQVTAHVLVGTFDPSMVLKGGYRREYFVPGPLARAMQNGGILYVEEINRAPSGALNAMLTALSEGYVEIPHFGRVEAAPGFMVVGAANPLDDVGTARLSRGLLDRFILIELGYQPRDEEVEIVRRQTGDRLPDLRTFAVDLARRTREHPDLRHGASVRAAIDFVNLVAEWYEAGGIPDRQTLPWLACAAYAGRMRVRPTATKSACEILMELFDALLVESYGGDFGVLLQISYAGEPIESDNVAGGTLGEEGEVALAEGGQTPPDQREQRDELPGLGRPGGSGEPGESRSVPMVGRDRPVAGGGSLAELDTSESAPLAAFDEVIRHALGLTLQVRGVVAERVGAAGGRTIQAAPWKPGLAGELDVIETINQYAARAGSLHPRDIRLLERAPEMRNYLILVDHSGSMVGRKLTLAAVMAGVVAELSAAGRANYGVIAFDEELTLIKDLAVDEDLELVIERILRLPEGRATDLSRALLAAIEASDHLPDATDTILISDCMPTTGVTSFEGLATFAQAIPSLHICYTDEQIPAIEIFHQGSRFDLYEWWARRWVGDDRVYRMQTTEDVHRLVDGLSAEEQVRL